MSFLCIVENIHTRWKGVVKLLEWRHCVYKEKEEIMCKAMLSENEYVNMFIKSMQWLNEWWRER